MLTGQHKTSNSVHLQIESPEQNRWPTGGAKEAFVWGSSGLQTFIPRIFKHHFHGSPPPDLEAGIIPRVWQKLPLDDWAPCGLGSWAPGLEPNPGLALEAFASKGKERREGRGGTSHLGSSQGDHSKPDLQPPA